VDVSIVPWFLLNMVGSASCGKESVIERPDVPKARSVLAVLDVDTVVRLLFHRPLLFLEYRVSRKPGDLPRLKAVTVRKAHYLRSLFHAQLAFGNGLFFGCAEHWND
jgi:hypothetical protein